MSASWELFEISHHNTNVDALVPFIVTFIRIIELLLMFATFILIHIYGKIIKQNSPFHPNLQLNLILVGGTQFAFIFIRLVVVLHFLLGLHGGIIHKSAEILSDASQLLLSLITSLIVFERLLAAVFVDKYEKVKSPWIMMGAFVFMLILSLALITLVYLSFISPYMVFGFLFGLFCLSSIFFVFLPCISYQLYKRVLRNRYNGLMTISHRYQSEQNLKCSKMLRYVVPFIAISTLVSIALYFGLWKVQRQAYSKLLKGEPTEWLSRYGEILVSSYYTFVVFQSMSTVLVTLFSHPTLRKHFIEFVCSRCKKKTETTNVQELNQVISSGSVLGEGHSSVSIPKYLKSQTGVQLSYDKTAEREMYFKTLNKMWK